MTGRRGYFTDDVLRAVNDIAVPNAVKNLIKIGRPFAELILSASEGRQ